MTALDHFPLLDSSLYTPCRPTCNQGNHDLPALVRITTHFCIGQDPSRGNPPLPVKK